MNYKNLCIKTEHIKNELIKKELIRNPIVTFLDWKSNIESENLGFASELRIWATSVHLSQNGPHRSQNAGIPK